jgi:hypothetical protein
MGEGGCEGGDEKDDSESEDADVPLSKRRKMDLDHSSPVGLLDGREPGDTVQTAEEGQCVLVARTVSGWNVRYSSQDALDLTEYFVYDFDLV